MRPIWRAYLAQTEPLGYFYLVPLVVSPFLLAGRVGDKRASWLALLAALLPITALLHTFVFKAKVSLAMRPPYLVYLLPLVLILVAAAAYLAIQRVQSRWLPRLLLGYRPRHGGFVGRISIWTTKGVRKKANWRDMVAYVEADLPQPNLLFF